MAVIAVGDFDADDMERLIEEQFSDLAAPQNRQRAGYDLPSTQAHATW